MEFKAFDGTARAFIDKWIKDKKYEGSELSNLGFLAWFYDLEYAVENNTLYLKGRYEDELLYWKPLTYGDINEAIKKIPENIPLHYFTQDEIKDIDKEKYEIRGFRDEADYIYKRDDFVNMVGKKWHGKRNHVAKFKSLYPNAELKPYESKYRAKCLEFAIEWVKYREEEEENLIDDMLEREYMLLSRMLDGVERQELRGAILCIDEDIIGLTVAEVMPSGVAIVMYEKADTDYEGSYTYLANTFAKDFLKDVDYLNRQEDMGMEGLRKSKLSYNPDHLLERYSIIKKEYVNELDDLFADRDIKDIEDDYIQLYSEDFNTVWDFLIDGIEGLVDKKFFMNYTEDELKFVLEHGYMLAHVRNGKIVATCGVDSDREYGDELKEICGGDKDEGQYFEFSGIMVKAEYRGRGFGREVCKRVIEWAKQNVSPCTLCAVVQYDNIPSLRNLQKLGFKERAIKEMGEYNFKYLTLKI